MLATSYSCTDCHTPDITTNNQYLLSIRFRPVMSLFGSSPPSSRQTKSSLFDEEPTSKSGSGLFADDSNTGSSSPWDFPSPKKSARKNLVKSLLQNTEVPETYIDTYDSLISSGSISDNGVSLDGVKGLLSRSNIGAGDQAKILEIVGQNEQGLGRSEFNVVLALVGLAQEGEELSLDAVDERRKSESASYKQSSIVSIRKEHMALTCIELPNPSLPSLQAAPKQENKPQQPSGAAQSSAGAPPARSGELRQPSFGLEADPWASPAMHKGHDHSAQNGNTPYTNGAHAAVSKRTTSTFTTSASDQPEPATTQTFESTQQSSTASGGAGWEGFPAAQGNGFSSADTSGDPGFGGGDDGLGAGQLPRHIGAPKRTGGGVEEVVTVNILDEKEGMFLFQHRNYEVASVRRNSKVIRRYSDFVWLLDCLHKRYPFRQLPLLPPKRVASMYSRLLFSPIS